MPILYWYKSFAVREYVDYDGLGEGIWDLFEEIDIVIKNEVETSGILIAKPGEQLQNITFMPLLIL